MQITILRGTHVAEAFLLRHSYRRLPGGMYRFHLLVLTTAMDECLETPITFVNSPEDFAHADVEPTLKLLANEISWIQPVQ